MIVRLLKWTVIGVVCFLALGAGIIVMILDSADPEAMPNNHGKVSVQLFKGDGERQPLIVGFGGSEGGNAWASERWKIQRDRFLDQGYAFLAVGYFGSEGTPEELDRIAIDGVHDAILQVADDQQINGRCIALIGGSKGAELALLLGSEYEEYGAIVGLVPGNAAFPALTTTMDTPSFSLDGKPLPFVPVPWSATPALVQGDLRAAYSTMLEDADAVEQAAIPVEQIEGPILLLSATEDEVWPSREMSDAIVRRLADEKFDHYFEHIPVEGGHGEPLEHFGKIENFLASRWSNKDGESCAVQNVGR